MRKITVYFKNLWRRIRFRYYSWRFHRAMNSMVFSFAKVLFVATENAVDIISDFALALQAVQQTHESDTPSATVSEGEKVYKVKGKK